MECLLCAPHTACAVTFHPHSSPVTQNYNHHLVTHEETGPGQVRHFCEVTRLGNCRARFQTPRWPDSKVGALFTALAASQDAGAV